MLYFDVISNVYKFAQLYWVDTRHTPMPRALQLSFLMAAEAASAAGTSGKLVRHRVNTVPGDTAFLVTGN